MKEVSSTKLLQNNSSPLISYDLALKRSRILFPHAECKVLEYLHKKHGLVDYVGVSKSACLWCDFYFDEYRKQTGTSIRTRGSHGQATEGWMCVTLNDPLDSKIQDAFRQRVLYQFVEEWRHFTTTSRRRSNTLTSQSSGGSRSSVEIDKDKAGEWGKIRGRYSLMTFPLAGLEAVETKFKALLASRAGH